jgi:hypothetical protein
MRFKKDTYFYFLFFFLFLFLGTFAKAQSPHSLKQLQKAYPTHVKAVTTNYIAWQDGTRIPIESSSSFLDKLIGLFYHFDPALGIISKKDIQQERYEPLFRKMYGNSANEVKKNLVTIYWMPNVFGKRFPLKVTTINNVHKKLQRISSALEKLPPTYYKYLATPAGSFYWRKVEGETYLSSHSFGIAIDINSHYSNYWLWDYLRLKRPISELSFHNRIPKEIVQIFAKEGFFWGGNWYYYDTMHFEYRPDLLM